MSHCPGKENLRISFPEVFRPQIQPKINCDGMDHLGDLELRREFQIIQNKCAVRDHQFVLDLNKYSDLYKVLKIRILTKIFSNRLKKLPIEIGPCNVSELLEAEQNWKKYEQNLVHSSELQCIKSVKLISKTSSLYKLDPFLDDNNVLRVRVDLKKVNFLLIKITNILLPN
ncbi:integrase catalytic domain-containing protein [Nephila pilipes]|uniref:Integrase catalytic domain-containing protein n=1 Tax=Nephila pilipes TaxID=299642 RepID=A0A8X6UB11_NEPPI|nr:integrase catalytic domain-containing protein [Nephila pilipes]